MPHSISCFKTFSSAQELNDRWQFPFSTGVENEACLLKRKIHPLSSELCWAGHREYCLWQSMLHKHSDRFPLWVHPSVWSLDVCQSASTHGERGSSLDIRTSLTGMTKLLQKGNTPHFWNFADKHHKTEGRRYPVTLRKEKFKKKCDNYTFINLQHMKWNKNHSGLLSLTQVEENKAQWFSY